MNSLAALLTPLAALLPAAAAQWPVGPALEAPAANSAPEDQVPASALSGPGMTALQALDQARNPLANQVRIEQRVIIRIAPSSQGFFARTLAQLDRDADEFDEVRLDGCVPINMIAAVHPQESRLLLFMRDRRLLTATLEKACNPEDFYSGFYIERQDGQLCERRDELRARSGATCKVARLNRLVAARD
jgi:hypothetical protein